MRGMFVIARYSILELTRGRKFLIILILALLVDFLMSYGLYYVSTQSAMASEIQENQRHPMFMPDSESPMNFLNPEEQNFPIFVIKNALRWLVYVVYIFFGNFLAIFGAVGLIGPELDKRSIYTLISKPLSRTHIFLGKTFGLFGALFLYAVIVNLAVQLFFLFSGAGFQPSLFIASAIGFLNFMIFGLLALLLSSRLNAILAAGISMILLWISTNAGTTLIREIGKGLFKFGDIVDYFILLLPSQKSIGNYAVHFLFDKYYTGMLDDIPSEIFELVTKDPHALIQPFIWFGAVFVLGYLSFFRKEFD